MALISPTPTRLQLEKEVIEDLVTLVHDLDSLDEPLGDVIRSRINAKINHLQKWIESPENTSDIKISIEIDTLELLMEVVLQNRPRDPERCSIKKIMDKSQRIGRSIRLLNVYI